MVCWRERFRFGTVMRHGPVEKAHVLVAQGSSPWVQSVAPSAWLVFASWAYFGPTVVGSRHTDEDAFLDGDNGVITK